MRAFILGGPSCPERIPFASNELLFKPLCRYSADAAAAFGLSGVSLLLPPEDRRLAGCFPPNTPVFAYGKIPAGELCPSDRVLLLADDAVSITPAHLAAFAEQDCAGLTDRGRFVAAVAPGAVVSGLSCAGDVLRRLSFREVREVCPEPFDGLRERNCRELFSLSERMRQAILFRWLDAGVNIAAPDGVLIGPDAEIGDGTVILPGTELRGHTRVGRCCVIGPNSILTDSDVGDGCTVEASRLTGAVLHERVRIGPFSQLRPGSELLADVKVGDFVEIKNSRIGEKTSVAHLTYVGDSDVGGGVNFGCGVVTCNYDGVNKYRTVIGDGAFIGCNTNLVAPVKVGEGAYTAAGTTVTGDVPPDALAVGRSPQINRPNWASEFKKRKRNEKK